MRIVLAGTPNFSVTTFQKIIENFNVVSIISQPNKPVGRQRIIMDTPVCQLAKKYKNIKLFQPNKIEEIYEELKNLDFDILITMAYGQIISKKILDLAKNGSFNIHASLLPKYRGASPIQKAILTGEKVTGITFMKMNEKMDAGNIIFQETIDIDDEDNYDTLLKKLSFLSSEKIVDWLKKIEKKEYVELPQNDQEASYSYKITKEDEKLKFTTMDESLRIIRSLSTNPGAYTILNNSQGQFKNSLNKRIKIYNATKKMIPNAIEIKCIDGSIYAIDYQFEGKNRVILNDKK